MYIYVSQYIVQKAHKKPSDLSIYLHKVRAIQLLRRKLRLQIDVVLRIEATKILGEMTSLSYVYE